MPHQVPDRPWQILAADMFVLGKDKYLVLVDYYSKYFELTGVTDSTSNTVVNVLQQHLAIYGLPETLYTDNGPEFASKEFFNFVRNYQFQHITSSQIFSQSSGFVERTTQTAKKLLKKACDDGSDPHLAILELRNTPIQGVGLSPMQLLMGRRVKTLIYIYIILFLKLSPLWFIIYFLFLFLKDIYKRLIYLNLQRFGHFKCPSSGDNCC